MAAVKRGDPPKALCFEGRDSRVQTAGSVGSLDILVSRSPPRYVLSGLAAAFPCDRERAR